MARKRESIITAPGVLGLVLAFALLISCGGRGTARTELPPDPPLSVGLGWALVMEAYAPVRQSPSFDVPQSWSARRGSIMKVGESRYDPRGPQEGGTWYSVSGPEGSGWIHSFSVEIHPSEARAKNAAAALR